MPEITQEILHKMFEYRKGDLIRKIQTSGNAQIGDVAGSISKNGYISTSINGKLYLNHRLIFLMYHGYLPEFLDHIDCNPSNNDISNLRAATIKQNGMNRKKDKSYAGIQTLSKFKGVSLNKQLKKWISRIGINGKRKHLGYFTSEIEAAKAYDTAAIKLYGEFAKLNFDTQNL